MNYVWNRTKIVATIGPASSSKEVLTEMFEYGVDVCRLNASHGDHAMLQNIIDTVRAVNEETGMTISLLLDLQGPKIRIGKLDQPYAVKAGDIVKLSTTATKPEGNILPMDFEPLAREVEPGQLVLIEDGKVELKILETNGVDLVTLEVVNGSSIGSRKGVNLPQTVLSIPSMTDKDREDLQLGIKNKVEWIALSFVRKADDVNYLRRLLHEANSNARVIAKIEKPEALKNIDEIIEVSDAIMVARGDLGVEIPIEDVPLWQKAIVRKCNQKAKPVIVATQMLESMIENARPTRAEATDVANAVLDGTDAVMLSGETSVGKYPLEVVKTMQRICQKAEQDPGVYKRDRIVHEESPTYLSDAICLTACVLANKIKAKAIVSMTRSGYTAFQLSTNRPNANIFIFTDNRDLLNTLNLVWGVRAYYYDKFVGTNETISDITELLKKDGHLEMGDVIVSTASMPMHARKRTNMVKITVVE